MMLNFYNLKTRTQLVITYIDEIKSIYRKQSYGQTLYIIYVRRRFLQQINSKKNVTLF